jgi:hypothetical protein
MLAMLVSTAAPASLAYFLRWSTWEDWHVPCDYLYHPQSNDVALLHGTLENQLLYTDVNPKGGTLINKTAQLCVSGTGDFCYEV